MGHRSKKGMRVLPLCTVALMAAASVSTLLSGASPAVNAATAAPARTGDYEINGREYERDGIIYDVPNENEASRDATVVRFPNHAVIPSYIDVDGVRYTVREIRKGAAQTDIDDPDGWVTLPPTLRRARLTKPVIKSNPSYDYLARCYGVHNVVVTDLDSFLNMENFSQQVTRDGSAGAVSELKGNWRLYLNGEELKNYDYMYPEGSTMGTSLVGLLGVRSITVPASDTIRKTPLYRNNVVTVNKNPLPVRLQFKADKGYDLRYYGLMADTLVLPRDMTEFKGIGNLCNDRFFIPVPFKGVVWPDSLRMLGTTVGLSGIRIEDLPTTVVQAGNDLASDICEFSVGDTVTIPTRLMRLENVNFKPVYGTGAVKRFNVEDSPEPLYISWKINFEKVSDEPVFYLGRNIATKDKDSYFVAEVPKNRATVILGAGVSQIPFRLPIRLRDPSSNRFAAPRYLECRGLTPPEFPVERPEILDWSSETILKVPEAAVEAYRSHPVWRQFRTIQTTAADQIQMEREVVSERWISLDGRMLTAPDAGKINIQVTTCSDGATVARKVAVPVK